MADELRDVIRRAIEEWALEWRHPYGTQSEFATEERGDLAKRIERAVAQHLPYEVLLLREEKALADSEFKTVTGHLAELEAEVRRLVRLEPDNGPGYVWSVHGLGGLSIERVPRIAALLREVQPEAHA